MTEPIAQTGEGAVAGVWQDSVAAFYGVPYAAAPVGPLRFAAPVSPQAWDGVRKATRPGPTAPQPVMPTIPAVVVPGDDILHVNVHTPSLSPAEALPVFVWIHGGGWVIGSNADPAIDGARLAATGMVVVSANYRLGVDGFAALDGAPDNRAVLDWLAALRWVQDNAAAFGGDPSRVTIGGQSAGSAAVLLLSALPAAAGLFRRVVAMSGVCWNLPERHEAVAGAAKLAAHLGVTRTAADLSAVDPHALLTAQNELAPFGGFDPTAQAADHAHKMATERSWLAPLIDGDIVPERPYEALLGGARRDLDLLIGSTLEEVDALFMLLAPSMERPSAEAALVRCGLSHHQASTWLDGRPDHTPAAALGSAITNLVFRAPALHIADARVGGPGRTFVYETTWKPPTVYGSVHSLDVPYVFGNLDAPHLEILAGGPPPQSLADDLTGALAGFVIAGDPGWRAWTEDEHVSMHFDIPSTTVAEADDLVRQIFADHPRP